ncbi:MAG: hypothetical protein IJF84_00115 [Thermoguttaceae bacterium]|nr:hypothetical protein [Thermoguttaceae bacterium]
MEKRPAKRFRSARFAGVSSAITFNKNHKEMENEHNSDDSKKLDSFMSIVSDFFDSLATCIENKDGNLEGYSKEIQKIDALLARYPQSSFLESWRRVLESYKFCYEDSSLDIPNCYISILEKDPFCVNAYEELAVYYYINDNYPLAEKLFRTALQLEPFRESLHVGLCRVLLEQGLKEQFAEEQHYSIELFTEVIDNLHDLENEEE